MSSAITLFSKKTKFENVLCDVFDDWEICKDEILPRDLKVGKGNGTVHVYLGSASEVSPMYKTLAPLFPNYVEPFKGDEIPKIEHYVEHKDVLQLIFECLHYRSKVDKAQDYEVKSKTDILLKDPNDIYFSFESELKISEGRFYFKILTTHSKIL
jgi:hypothetical protein